MLRRKIGDIVFINPYYNIVGLIIDSREVNETFNNGFDYIIQFDEETFIDKGWKIRQEYYSEDELDKLNENWIVVKGIN